jgi:molecular chaperone IbpA
MRNSVDFTPLYRSAVGFDRLFALLDNATRSEAPGWPPYNIERVAGETPEAGETYRIELAVAGFRPDQLTIESKENVLTVTGRKDSEEDGRVYLHRGLAERSFERRFQLADHIRVTDAELSNGLLSIGLTREVPEALKPRTIAIKTTSETPQVLAAAE